MAKQIKLGINFFFSNSSNSGVVNYIYNLISALKTLPDEQKPLLTVFYSANAPVDYLKEIDYPQVYFVLFKPYSSHRIVNGINKILQKLIKRNYYFHFKYLSQINVLYPYFEFNDIEFKKLKHKIHWLVDFNNCAFPSHYSDNGEQMKKFQTNLTERNDHIVLSSQSLLDELKLYYPNYKNKVSILRFACSLPDISRISINELRNKFDLRQPYFMSPNQFWEHKNQLVLIEAMHILKSAGLLNFQVVFTGSMDVNRGKGHLLPKLLNAVKLYRLEDYVRFLGIIDRNDQLKLMKHAEALIQPSLYEGWSTLVEEAKALNQKIILSDLPVHREQNCVNSYFFNPASPEQLSEQIKSICQNKIPPKKINYLDNIKQFGQDILSMLHNEFE